MKNVKTAVIIGIVCTVLVIGLSVVLLTRKQTINPETGEVKSYWGKSKAGSTTEDKPEIK